MSLVTHNCHPWNLTFREAVEVQKKASNTGDDVPPGEKSPVGWWL